MGVKDIEEKQFEDYNDVFADIVNVLLFGGREIMKLMTALTGDSRYEDGVNEILKKERGVITMSGWLDEAERRGEKRGEKLGRFKLIIQMVNDCISRKNLTQRVACEDLNIDYSEYQAAKRFMKVSTTEKTRF